MSLAKDEPLIYVMKTWTARKAVDAGVSGIIVSNHGGRQLDYSPAPISVLEEAIICSATSTKIMFPFAVSIFLY